MTILELQSRMESGAATARALTESYLQRIAEIDRQGPTVNAVIELNPDALDIAAALDAERAATGPRGPLHGIPVILKDNIDTADRMMTTSGSLALTGSIAPEDAFVTDRLRRAGAVILGKSNLSEWANFRSDHSSSGWSNRGGQTRNPYALDRNPWGDSSGSAVAVAADLCSVGVGTETDGSLVCPAQANGIVSMKPTVDLVSRFGIIPISHSLDKHRLDAIMAPSGGPAALTDWANSDKHPLISSIPAAVAGYPNITVPAGYIHDLPVGISFFSTAYQESTLFRIPHAFEQATQVRRPPRFLPSVDGDA